MSDRPRTPTDGETLFGPRTVALLLVVGIAGFIGMMVMGAFAPDWRNERDGGPHALSNAAIGFEGIVRLARTTGRNPRIVRDGHQFGGEDLLVLTPPSGLTDVSEPLRLRRAKPTLVILPKWFVAPDRRHRGWVRVVGLTSPDDPEGVLAPDHDLVIRRRRDDGRPLVAVDPLPRAAASLAPRPVQVIAGLRPPKAGNKGAPAPPPPVLTPLVTDGEGGTVVAQLGQGPLYVVADPDLLDNRGMRDPRNAKAALALLDWMNSTGATGIDFDVTLNGLGRSPSPLKLAFEPPFLAMTLTVAAALFMAGLHALGRFGPVARTGRAIAFGKAALVDNSAALIRKAGREAALGPRYVAAMRERAAIRFGVPTRLRGAAVDFYLDRIGRYRFTDLARATEAATDRHALAAHARALHDWQEGNG